MRYGKREMDRTQLDALLSDIRTAREASLAYLVDIPESDFPLPVDLPRWDEVRRVLLRLGEHMREHANQIEGARADLGRRRTMPQRMLTEAELSWGQLLAATTALNDADLDAEPKPGSWSIRQVLEHILASERKYLAAVQTARAQRDTGNAVPAE